MIEPADFSKFNAGQLAFVDQQARVHLVRWCELQLLQTEMGLDEFNLRPRIAVAGEMTTTHNVYWDFAVSKGWVSSKKEMVTSKGFKTASSMVKKGTSALT